ncbi:MAG: 7-cyano-7-deazaguanine synthase [Acidobacteria bacterium]|nr:7-cyano-7-deazaguanine synthase [Acidobacteriota bacterium]
MPAPAARSREPRENTDASPATVVLLSGGLDSAVLLAHEGAQAPVLPLYVASGLAWEALEREMVARLLTHLPQPSVWPLQVVDVPVTDVYPPGHWALTGHPPAYDTPDEDVYLIGRNVLLLGKAAVVAARRRAMRIVLGPLAGNPFPDARPPFFEAMATAMSLGLDHPLVIEAPFLTWQKSNVIRRGVALGVDFTDTLSCMNPVATAALEALPAVHCGRCSKCRERRDAFAEAGVTDPTSYAHASPR